MEKQSLVILFPDTAKQNAYLQQMGTFLEADSSLSLHYSVSLTDLGEKVSEAKYSVAIFNLKTKVDLVEVINFLGSQQEAIKNRKLRVIGSSALNHPDVVKILMKKGCADILPSNLNQKALRHKISQSFKILENHHAKAASDLKLASEAKAETAAIAKKAQGPSYRILPPLALASDFWLIQNEKDLRPIQGRWIIDLLGPGPSAGAWDETVKDSKVWFWSSRIAGINGASDPFLVDPGTWRFTGRKPEFIWQESRWRFLGDHPELVFVAKDQTVLATRFKVAKDQTMEASENSSFAKDKLALILKTIDTEVRFRNEQAKKGNTKDLKIAPEAQAADLSLKKEQPAQADDLALKNSQNSPSLKMWLDAETGPIEITPVEYSDREVLAEVLTGSVSEGQRYKFVVECGAATGVSKEGFSTIAKDIQVGDDGKDIVCIKILDDVVFPTQNMNDALADRQEEILDFMKMARGW